MRTIDRDKPDIAERSGSDRAAAAVVIGAGVLLAFLATARLWTFEAGAFDTGYLNNVLWKIANGYGDVTGISGLHHFADHVSPLLLLAVPLYMVLPGMALPVLLIAQAASVALVAWAGWLVSGYAGLSLRVRRAVLALTLLGPAAWYSAMVEFHASGLALGPLAMTLALGIRRSESRWYWVWPLLASLARVELAGAVLVAAFLLYRYGSQRHAAISGATAGVIGFGMLLWMLFTPWDGTSVSAHFWHLEDVDGLLDLPAALIAQPGAFLRNLVDPSMLWAVLYWLLGFLVIAPLRAARWLLVALPVLAIPILGGWPPADRWFEHYWHALYPALAIATPLGLRDHVELQRVTMYGALPAVVLMWMLGGPQHHLVPNSFGLPPITADRSADLAVADFVNADPEAAVSSSWSLTAHIGHRETIHLFPTPFTCPTVPLAQFVPPRSAPDLVVVDDRERRSLSEEEEPDVLAVLEDYYEPALTRGPITVYRLTGTPPAATYDTSCDSTQQLEEILGKP